MNEFLARAAIKNLIVSNSGLFVDGLTSQGNPRVIHQVTSSRMTPPTGYYFINIYISDIEDSNNTSFKTSSIPPSIATYSINIEISDYAIANYDEDQLFEKMDGDFQILTDRIVAKIRESNYIVEPNSNKEFKLGDNRRVIKNNLSDTWEEASQYHALLYSRISFDLVDECTDDSTLYEF